jgi:LysM repeat protein
MVHRIVRFLVCFTTTTLMVGVSYAPASAACTKNYTVKQGDSWWRIAEKNDTTLKRVLKLNQAKQSTRILPGDQVCIPAVAGPVAKPPKNEFTKAQVIQFIRDAWPDQLEERALAIAQRESNLQPSALSGSKCCYGLFQIYYRWHTTWLPQVGITSSAQMFDPRLNAAAAYRLYQRNGWGPWE